MADLTGGQLVARTLKQAGVGDVFTLCGGHILPIYDGCLTEGIRIIDTRHEQAAAVVVPSPGVTDAVTGVANAYAAPTSRIHARSVPCSSGRSRPTRSGA